jgi:hypothetical protein
MSTLPVGIGRVHSLAALDSRARQKFGVGGMHEQACGADGNLVRGTDGGRADEGPIIRQASEERGEGVGVG